MTYNVFGGTLNLAQSITLTTTALRLLCMSEFTQLCKFAWKSHVLQKCCYFKK